MCDCPSFDKETETCNRQVNDLKDPHCFNKNMLWLLSMILQELQDASDDRREGDEWKNQPPT